MRIFKYTARLPIDLPRLPIRLALPQLIGLGLQLQPALIKRAGPLPRPVLIGFELRGPHLLPRLPRALDQGLGNRFLTRLCQELGRLLIGFPGLVVLPLTHVLTSTLFPRAPLLKEGQRPPSRTFTGRFLLTFLHLGLELQDQAPLPLLLEPVDLRFERGEPIVLPGG